ncbi:hypothetical protein CIRG_06150 [Coccidioides immitis RMSCC 2394]|uniref:Uncharacterized protein n=1 Tax=Coccidioides immitis RMSCC 2394 TaxID=404692 RepID=A0A0J6YHB5_COCIT|nr:hypothetical protein CIRG_06150 [Coccidioides immitis RMSCC 2394]
MPLIRRRRLSQNSGFKPWDGLHGRQTKWASLGIGSLPPSHRARRAIRKWMTNQEAKKAVKQVVISLLRHDRASLAVVHDHQPSQQCLPTHRPNTLLAPAHHRRALFLQSRNKSMRTDDVLTSHFAQLFLGLRQAALLSRIIRLMSIKNGSWLPRMVLKKTPRCLL